MIKKIISIIFLSLVFSLQVLAVEPIRVMVFSAPFGSGHNTAANRIKDVITTHYKAQGIPVEIVVKNTLEFAPKFWVDIALKQFSLFQSHAPILYTAMFEHYLNQANKVENAGEMKLFKQLRIDTNKMDAFIARDGFKNSSGQGVAPDLVFSTWPGSTEAIINLRNQKNSQYSRLSTKIPLAHVQTDNATHDRYFHLFAQGADGQRGADVVYVPSVEVYNEYVRLGFKNVVFTGMPLKLKTDQLPSREDRELEKQNARKELGLPIKNRTIMIEAGKNGGTNYAVIIASLIKFSEGMPLNIIAACGENEAYLAKLELLKSGARRGTAEFKTLLAEMKELYSPRNLKKFLKIGKKVFVLNPTMTKAEVESFIEAGLSPAHVNLIGRGYGPLEPLRAASDVVLTKPGGLSTAELGAEGRPMIVLQEYASGEALPNGPLFEKKNLAVINPEITLVGAQVNDLLGDEAKLASMYNSSNEFRLQFKLERVIPLVERVRHATANSSETQNSFTHVSSKTEIELLREGNSEGRVQCIKLLSR